MSSEFTQRVIAEFRANEGRVGRDLAATPIILIHHLGARTRTERVTPLAYSSQAGNTLVIAASNGGSPTHPAWYHNLLKHPEVTVEVGKEKFKARAHVADGDEYERLYTQHADINPGFHDYRKKTTRKIPVVLLERIH